MRISELHDLAPEILKRITLPEDRTKDLKRRVRATELATKFATEFWQRVMDDAVTDQDEAWDECAELFGYKSLDDLQEQGYGMVLYGNQLQLRRMKDFAPEG